MTKRKRTKCKENITQKTKERENRTTLKSGVDSCAPEGLAVPAPDGLQATV